MSDNPKKFYLTTPIYYVNARPHIGHAYTTIVADVIARRHRILGDDTFFLTGTDEHGQKIERSALAAGVPPQQFADEVSATFRDLWKRMGITNDAFIRTTEPRHKQGVQRLFQTLQERGHIYLSTYTGQYCVSDEAYVDGPPGIRCPDCGRVTETVSEENFYFRLSAFQLPLLDLIESDHNGKPPQLLITPESRRNEVLSFLRGDVNGVVSKYLDMQLFEDNSQASLPHGRAFPTNIDTPAAQQMALDDGTLEKSGLGYPYVPGALKDLSISRTSFKWGIPVPGHEDHVIYVWLDALANYMTAIGYGSDDPAQQAQFEKFWPADLHLVGKEIIRFHCVYWPAFLLALNPAYNVEPTTAPGAPRLDSETWVSPEAKQTAPPPLSLEQHQAWAAKMLPKAITAHGWLLFEDSKMSKSRGNIVRTETILDAFGEHVYKKQFPDSTKQEQDLFATDVLRYFLLREIPFGQDGSFSFDALITRYNADLANGYGNLVSRTLNMLHKYFGGVIPSFYVVPSPGGPPFLPHDTIEVSASSNIRRASGKIENCSFDEYTKICWSLIRDTDEALSRNAPWKDRQTPSETQDNRALILYTAAESIRIITALLHPILPHATAQVWAQLGLGDIQLAAENGQLNDLTWGGLQPGTKLGPLAPIFPRADKGLAEIMTDMENPQPPTDNEQQTTPPGPSRLTTETTSTAPATPTDPTHPGAPPRTGSLPESNPITQVAGSASATTELHKTPSHTEAQPSGPFNTQASAQPISGAAPGNASPQITIDDFAKVELRVAKILVAERIPKADKLLRLEVDLGYEKRQILSGIAEWYTPEELIGRKIVVITNLAPRKMRGLDSHGMLLAASSGGNGKPALATFADSDDIEVGARLK